MSTRILRTARFALSIGLCLAITSPSQARTTKRTKTTKRIVVSNTKSLAGSNLTPAEQEAIKAEVLAVFKRFREIDIAANQNPENGAEIYREVLAGQAFKDYADVLKVYQSLGAYCDCSVANWKDVAIKFIEISSNSVELRNCVTLTGIVRLRTDNSIVKKYSDPTTSDERYVFSRADVKAAWLLTHAGHYQANGRSSTCAKGF